MLYRVFKDKDNKQDFPARDALKSTSALKRSETKKKMPQQRYEKPAKLYPVAVVYTHKYGHPRIYTLTP